MNIIRLTFYWSQVIGAILITLFMGVIPLIRGLINHCAIFYIICLSLIVTIGITLLIVPSIKELREAQKR